MGVTEQTHLPEVDFDSVDRTRGMDITIVTTAKTDEEATAPSWTPSGSRSRNRYICSGSGRCANGAPPVRRFDTHM